MGYQTIVVGSGVAAAAVVRGVLAADPGHAPLVLEAGPRVPVRDRRMWWDFVIHNAAPYDHCHDLPLPGGTATECENELVHAPASPDGTGAKTVWEFRGSRMMGYGGSTFHWGGWGLRFKKEDFKLHDAVGRGANWPITYDDLERFYCAAEELLSVSGEDPHGWTPRSRPYPLPAFEPTAADGPMMRAFDKLGIRYAAMPMARYRRCMTTGTCKYCPIGARFVGAAVLDELLESGRHPNLEARVRRPVSEILMDKKDRAAGVRYFDCETGHTREAYADRVVVCSGAYETPKLLLRSRNRFWPEGVGNAHDQVGRYLISHPFLYARGTMAANPDRLQQELDFPTLMTRHYDTPKEQRGGKLFLFRDRTKPRADLAGMMIAGRRPAEIAAAVAGPQEWELQGLMEEFAHPENRIGLGTGLNRLGLPQTRVRFHRAEGFDAASEERLGWMRAVLREMGLQVGTRPEKDFGVQPQRGDHAAGTCRMSDAPQTGVVDKDLRVHDVGNLFVCSNAVFPSGAAVNPTLTVTALALRLAAHLAGARKATPAPGTGQEG